MSYLSDTVKIVGASLSNICGEWRMVLPRGDVLTDPDEMLCFIYRRLQHSEAAKRQALEARQATIPLNTTTGDTQ